MLHPGCEWAHKHDSISIAVVPASRHSDVRDAHHVSPHPQPGTPCSLRKTQTGHRFTRPTLPSKHPRAASRFALAGLVLTASSNYCRAVRHPRQQRCQWRWLTAPRQERSRATSPSNRQGQQHRRKIRRLGARPSLQRLSRNQKHRCALPRSLHLWTYSPWISAPLAAQYSRPRSPSS